MNEMLNVETVAVNLIMTAAKNFIRNDAAMNFRFELRESNWYVIVGSKEKFVKSADINWSTAEKIGDAMGLIFAFGLNEPISESEDTWGFIFKETDTWDAGLIKIIKDWCQFAKVVMEDSYDNIIAAAERAVLAGGNAKYLERPPNLKKSI
jgi:hypothetical protein